MPEPEKLEREPPETLTSDSMKSVAASESVKVRVAVSPVVRDVRSELMAMVGGFVSAAVVSTVRERELSGSFSSWLVLPAASEKAALATEMIPLVVLLAFGVKVAV